MAYVRYYNQGGFDFAETIRQLREERHMSLNDAAVRTGLCRATISRWERGERVPTIEAFRKYIEAMGAKIIIVNQ